MATEEHPSYGAGLRNPDGFLMWLVGAVLAEYRLVGCQVSDLIQEGRIGIWRAEQSWRRKGCEIGERGYVTYLMVAAMRRMTYYLERVTRQLRVPADCPRPRRSKLTGTDADDGGMEQAEGGQA